MKTILIVDDEFDILSALKMIFTLEQYQVLTASNGRAALQVFDEQHPDLVLTDWMMPEMDGTEFSRLVRSNPATAAIPIILMSAAPSPPQGTQHWNVFLSKPVDIEELLARVRHFLPV